ncbi:MAG TPA: PAS domain S-box protein [Candidatus Binatia bacterium]
MAKPMQLLLIEDSEADAELIVCELERGGYELRWECVDTAAALQAAVQRQPWDLITCDWIMPGFGAPAALALLKEHSVEAPIIIIFGEVGEEVIVTAMKAGAHDVVSKQRLTRLVPVVERELRETEVRRARQRAEEALRSSERRYRRLFETAKDGILILDAPTGQIMDVNPFLLQLLGHSREELVGKRLWEISPFRDVAGNQEAFTRLQAEAYIRYEHLPLEAKDGRRVAVEFVSNSYQENGDRIVQCNVRDISERKRVEEQLVVQSTALASAANAMVITATERKKSEEARRRGDQRFRALIDKSLDLIAILDRDGTYRYLNPAHEAVSGFRPDELGAFSYSVSHDLQAPLRHVNGFSKLLLGGYADKLDERGKHYLDRVCSATERMGQLINDLLSLSQVVRGDMQWQPVNLSALAQTIAEELQKTQPDRQVEFVIATDLVTRGDAGLLRVVLDNLLGNAWKYTSKHPRARIEFGFMQVNGQPAYFMRDDGAGFDMAYAGKLFGAFQRLHRSNEFEGSGIGLATVRRIIHRHGGRIWAEGAVEQGATFYFTLAPSSSNE